MMSAEVRTVFVLLKSSRRLRSTRASIAPPGLWHVGQPIGMLHEHSSVIVVESQPCDAPRGPVNQPVNGAHARHSVVCVGERGGRDSATGRWCRGQQMHQVTPTRSRSLRLGWEALLGKSIYVQQQQQQQNSLLIKGARAGGSRTWCRLHRRGRRPASSISHRRRQVVIQRGAAPHN